MCGRLTNVLKLQRQAFTDLSRGELLHRAVGHVLAGFLLVVGGHCAVKTTSQLQRNHTQQDGKRSLWYHMVVWYGMVPYHSLEIVCHRTVVMQALFSARFSRLKCTLELALL